jgi:hypothetical protein
MKTKQRFLGVAMSVIAAQCLAVTPSVLPLADGFEGYTNGTVLAAIGTNGWSVAGVGAQVVSNTALAAQSSTNYLAIQPVVTVSNTCSTAVLRAWVDFWIKPVFGDFDTHAPVAQPSLQVGFATNGYLAVNNGGTWTAYSNDIQLGSVPEVASNAWQRVTLFCDYSRSNAALFINGQLLRQEVAMSGAWPSLTNVVWDGTTDPTALDEVRFSATVPPGLTSNLNFNGLSDADELQTYDYCARLLRVGPGQTYPTLTGAVAVARGRDILVMSAGTYTGDVNVATSLYVVGSAFAITGNLAVAAGQEVVATNAINCSGGVSLGANGTLTLSNTTLNCSTLSIAAGGVVQVVNGTVVADGVTRTGTFTLDYRWGTLAIVAQPLDFNDTFEGYAVGKDVSQLGWFGWGVDGTAAVVTNAATHTNLSFRCMALPSQAAASVSIASGGQKKIWTDLWVKPAMEADPEPAPVAPIMQLYFSTNGYLMVSNAAVAGGWDACSTDVFGVAVAKVQAGDWVRVSILQDFTAHAAAIFLRGRLVRQSLAFTGGDYTTCRVGGASDDGTLLDDVAILTNTPSALLSAGATGDGDGDGIADAVEIMQCGSTLLLPRGSVFKIR